MSTKPGNKKSYLSPSIMDLPFALPVLANKKGKKKCCKKYRKGKRCKKCPDR